MKKILILFALMIIAVSSVADDWILRPSYGYVPDSIWVVKAVDYVLIDSAKWTGVSGIDTTISVTVGSVYQVFFMSFINDIGSTWDNTLDYRQGASPTNWADQSIKVTTGEVIVDFDNSTGTLADAQVDDDILGQAPPTNWDVLAISGGGSVNSIVITNSDKTGYTLAPNGLDLDTSFTQVQNTVNAYFDTLIYGFMVFVDAGANTNTVIGVDGTPKNPVGTIAAAKTIADNLGYATICLLDGASETIGETMEDYRFVGLTRSATINLGGQDVDRSFFECLTVTGEQGGTETIVVINSGLSNADSLEIHARNCAIIGNLSLRAGSHFFNKCYTSVAGNSTPILDFADVGTTVDVVWSGYEGGIELQNMTTDHTISYMSKGQLIINANCDNGNITTRGFVRITNNGTSMNITKDAVFSRQEAPLWIWSNIDTSAVVDTALMIEFLIDRVWDEVLTGLTHNVNNSAGKRLRAVESDILSSGTAQVSGTPTDPGRYIILAAAEAQADDFYNGAIVKIIGGTGFGQQRTIEDYTGATDSATLHPGDDWITDPNATSDYEIIGGHAVEVNHIHTAAIDSFWEYPVPNIAEADGIGDSLMKLGDTLMILIDSIADLSARLDSLQDSINNLATLDEVADRVNDSIFFADSSDYNGTPGTYGEFLANPSYVQGAASGLDSTAVSNLLYRVIFGIPVGSGSDSTTLAERQAAFPPDFDQATGTISDAQVDEIGTNMTSISGSTPAADSSEAGLLGYGDTELTNREIIDTISGGGGGSDSTLISNLIYRIVFGIPKGSGSDSTTLVQRQVNMAAISGDETAADNFETMLDGTGGQTFSLGRLVLSNSSASATLDIQNAGSGHTVNIAANSGDGISLSSVSSVGFDIASGSNYGMRLIGPTADILLGSSGTISDGSNDVFMTDDVLATVTNVTNQVLANMTAISGDGPAADSLERILDGNRATVYLTQLDIRPQSGNKDAIIAYGIGTGMAFDMYGGATASYGMRVRGQATNSLAAYFEGMGTNPGVSIVGGTHALSLTAGTGADIYLGGSGKIESASDTVQMRSDSLINQGAAGSITNASVATAVRDTAANRPLIFYGPTASGSGANVLSLIALDTSGTDSKIPGVQIAIYSTDLTTLYAALPTKNVDSLVAFNLDNGDYVAVSTAHGYIFDSVTITVSGATTDTVRGYDISISVPGSPDLSTVYMYISGIDGVDPTKQAKLLVTRTVTPGSAIMDTCNNTYIATFEAWSADVDVNSKIEIALRKNKCYDDPNIRYNAKLQVGGRRGTTRELGEFIVRDSTTQMLQIEN